MNQDDNWGLSVLICIGGGIFCFVVLSDLVGRLSRIFVQEWPLISWGMTDSDQWSHSHQHLDPFIHPIYKT